MTDASQVIPWYKSAILKGIVTALCAQALKGVADHFHIKSDTLATLSLDPNGLADWIMNVLSTAALAYAAHARVVHPVPPVTLTKASADAANFSQPVKPAPPETPK